MNKLILSKLNKTWIFDIDGVICQHNGYLTQQEKIITKARDFINTLPKKDFILLLTSRKEEYRSLTEQFLKNNGIRFDKIFFNLPAGERILINDQKPKGLNTAISINTKRDYFPDLEIEYNQDI